MSAYSTNKGEEQIVKEESQPYIVSTARHVWSGTNVDDIYCLTLASVFHFDRDGWGITNYIYA